MRKVSIFAMAMCMVMSLSACESSNEMEEPVVPEVTPEPDNGNSKNDNNQNENEMVTRMRITVGSHTLTATLENNATAQAFAAKLPITLPMMDLYGREMCYRFPEALPADEARTRSYEVGEIVYYSPMHSFVIMYAQNGERFQMQSIGRVEGNVGIFDVIGDVVDVRFEKAE